MDPHADSVSGRTAEESLDRIADCLTRAERVVLLSHVNPDGDALGSMAALTLALRGLGKRAQALCPEEPPEKFQGLFAPETLEVEPGSRPEGAVDVCALLDAGEPERCGRLRDFLVAGPHLRLCVDHHPFHPPASGKAPFDETWIVPAAPSTGNLVLAILDRLGAPLTEEIARALWVALATDTGWFRFPNTTAWALGDAARLVAAGVDTEGIYQRLYADFTSARARVLGAILGGVRSELGGSFVWSALPRRSFETEGVGVADLDGMVDYLKLVRGARVTALIVQTEEDRWKVSLRALGAAEVGAVARSFGGGGHAKAAGFRRAGSLEDVVLALRRELEQTLGSGVASAGAPE